MYNRDITVNNKTMTNTQIQQIEKDVMQNFKSGNYQPLGADGGVLKYILCNTEAGQARASITLDSEIADIRPIWDLSIDTNGNGQKEIYNLKREYYKLRA